MYIKVIRNIDILLQ